MPSTHICVVPSPNFGHILAIMTFLMVEISTFKPLPQEKLKTGNNQLHISPNLSPICKHANCLSRHQCHLQTLYFNQDHYFLLMLWYVHVSLLSFHWFHSSFKAVHLLVQHSQVSATMQHSNSCDYSQQSKHGTRLSPTDGTYKYSNSSEYVRYYRLPTFVMHILSSRYSHKFNG